MPVLLLILCNLSVTQSSSYYTALVLQTVLKKLKMRHVLLLEFV